MCIRDSSGTALRAGPRLERRHGPVRTEARQGFGGEARFSVFGLRFHGQGPVQGAQVRRRVRGKEGGGAPKVMCILSCELVVPRVDAAIRREVPKTPHRQLRASHVRPREAVHGSTESSGRF